MSNSIYSINRDVNKPIEFRGLKAQYISYLAAGILVLLIFFVLLYFMGIPTKICLIILASLGIPMVILIYRLSDRYGAYGLSKIIARRKIPSRIRSYRRAVFMAPSATRKTLVNPN